MGKTRRFALTLSLSTALCVNAGLAFAQADEDDSADDKEPATAPMAAEGRPDRRSARADESPEERLARRRERLESGAKRLRERAAEMRKKAAAGETPVASPNAKRQPKPFAEQAQRLEEQALKMEDRAKNLDTAGGPAASGDRAASARDRRHRVRRIQLNRRWGDTLKDPEAIAELKLHAERAAKLKRIRTLAMKKSKDDPAVERSTKLLAKEVARHEKHMKEIQARTVAASVPAATPSTAAPSTTPPAEEATK
jgi:hypothetical protein